MNRAAQNLLVCVLLAAGTPAYPQAPAASPAPAAGGKIYQAKCSGCHSIAANRIGPAHKGVFGRGAGLAPGYNYSPALKTSKIVWNAVTLDKWLQGPQKMVKGSKMFLAVPNPADRAAIIAYLRSESPR